MLADPPLSWIGVVAPPRDEFAHGHPPTPPMPRLPPSPTIAAFVISVDRREICVGSHVISVDPRGSWG